MKRLMALALLALILGPLLRPLGADASAALDPSDPARLGYRKVAGDATPELILAQRTIDRDWGPSDDSVYVTIDVPGWKSEPLAATLSAALPGAGQVYVGEGNRWLYAALEAAGWGGWWWYRHDANRLRDEALGVAGPPFDAGSNWSFDRWTTATGGNPADIVNLYTVDRDAFLTAIGTDARYAGGWSSESVHGDFESLRGRSESRFHNSRLYAAGLWVNHIVSAVNALRAARFHNLPLARNVGMRIDPRVRGGRSGVTVAVVGRF